MWHVVKFPDENTVEAIPEKWIISEDRCYWPPYRGEDLKKSLMACETPEKSWRTYKTKILSNESIDDYNVAFKRCVAAQTTSDIEDGQNLPGKRQIIRNHFYDTDSKSSTTNEESEFDDYPTFNAEAGLRQPQMQNTFNSDKVKVGKQRKQGAFQPKKNEVIKLSDQGHCSSYKSRGSSQYTQNNGFDNATSSRVSSVVVSRCGVNNEVTNESRNFLQDSQDFTPTNKPFNLPGSHRSDDLLNKIIRRLNTLNAKLDQLFDDVNVIKQNMVLKPKNPIPQFPSIYSTFPIDSDEKFTEFEAFLETTDNFKHFVDYLQGIGGDNSYDVIKRALSRIIDNKIAMQFNWEGVRNKKKFQTLNITRALHIAIKNLLGDTEKNVEKNIKMWLKHAKERYEAQLKICK
ncbi:hypothetical protein FQR65_LT00741 [Abscondita terminalis]|nr:hypothetical protein FQR65_LT00741 [Abscondita terminalis]